MQELAAKKVDIVKIWVDDRDHQYTKLSPALYTAVIDEAHKNKLRVTAHIFALEDAKGLLKAGIDAFAHGIRDTDADADVMALFKSHPNVVVVPNMPDRGVVADYSWLKGHVPDGELQKIQAAATDRPQVAATWAIQGRNLKKLSDAGVKIALGTDGNTPWAPHVEMQDMVAAGMTPAQVIVAATKNGAEFLRMAATGTVANGQIADFLILDANPLDDITNTRKISAVYLAGALAWLPHLTGGPNRRRRHQRFFGRPVRRVPDASHVHQLQEHPAALGVDGLVLERHHADAGAVDVGDSGEIDQDLALVLLQQVVDPPSKLQVAIVKGDLAFER